MSTYIDQATSITTSNGPFRIGQFRDGATIQVMAKEWRTGILRPLGRKAGMCITIEIDGQESALFVSPRVKLKLIRGDITFVPVIGDLLQTQKGYARIVNIEASKPIQAWGIEMKEDFFFELDNGLLIGGYSE